MRAEHWNSRIIRAYKPTPRRPNVSSPSLCTLYSPPAAPLSPAYYASANPHQPTKWSPSPTPSSSSLPVPKSKSRLNRMAALVVGVNALSRRLRFPGQLLRAFVSRIRS
ncbi:hypothetical protein PIIN_08831 [Serendipita indica DSM 11827]|uniref:Uncharacterized protein n=1 Tax=Serendipita indica (strain DSM 11827) TaxID=1109443 RepID=G4TU64_SERID|nr:hypothetical protein PIIN_08831 [Serendipita indica DSM 11827]